MRGHPATVLINEQGLYLLIYASELKTAREFRRWVFKEVLPSIRKTDTCTVTAGVPFVGRQIRLLNENDLHFKVVEYIRKYHPQTLIIEGLGEFQKTQELRREGWCKVYTAGQPDIIIANPSNGYTGLAIELKPPKGTGVVNCKHISVLRRLGSLSYKTLVSYDFVDNVLEVHEYFQDDPTVEARKEIRRLKRERNKLSRKLDSVVNYNPHSKY